MDAVIREDVVDQTVAEIQAGYYPVGVEILMGVAGMPVSIGPDAQPFEDAVRARLGDGYQFRLVLAGSALVTRLLGESPL